MDHDQAQYRQLVDDGNFSAAFKVRSTSLGYELQDSFLIKEIGCSILELYRDEHNLSSGDLTVVLRWSTAS